MQGGEDGEKRIIMRTTVQPKAGMTWENVLALANHEVAHGHAVPLHDQSDVYHIDFEENLIQTNVVQGLSEWSPEDFLSISLDSE